MGMQSTEVHILEEPHEIRFRGFLKSLQRPDVEPDVGLVVHGDVSHEPLKRRFGDEQVGALLVSERETSNLEIKTKGHTS